MSQRIVLATSDVFVRRLVPALLPVVPARFDFRVVDIHRSPKELIHRIRELEPDGIITESLPNLTREIVGTGIPTVIADSDVTYAGSVSIDVDDEEVGRVAARFFRSAGYSHFACVHNGMPYSDQRIRGFEEVLEPHRVMFFEQPERRPRDYMESWNEPSCDLRAWLRGLPKPVGIFAVHDPLGRFVLDAAAEEGLNVPEDVAVLGANNDEWVCGLSHPPLSSVEIPWQSIGDLTLQWMLHLLEGKEPPGNAVLVRPGSVCIRNSTTLVAVEDPDIRKVVQYFHDHLQSEMTVGSVCEALRLPRRAIERKFALYFRSSPWRRLNAMRTEAAKTLLITTNFPMAVIAEKTGFPNAERFSVIFKQHTKMSPKAFRMSMVRN
ncbi:MAG: substrate-binding domain-containing protein [Luteolibacter sp.]